MPYFEGVTCAQHLGTPAQYSSPQIVEQLGAALAAGIAKQLSIGLKHENIIIQDSFEGRRMLIDSAGNRLLGDRTPPVSSDTPTCAEQLVGKPPRAFYACLVTYEMLRGKGCSLRKPVDCLKKAAPSVSGFSSLPIRSVS